MLFLKSDQQSARRLSLSRSALDDMLTDARSLKQILSNDDRRNLDEYMESVRQAEVKVAKAKKWLDAPLPTVEGAPLNLELTTDEPREYLQTMFDMIYLAFRTDSTRVATYQLGRENGIGRSEHLARAVGFNLSHQLSHETKNPMAGRTLVSSVASSTKSLVASSTNCGRLQSRQEAVRC